MEGSQCASSGLVDFLSKGFWDWQRSSYFCCAEIRFSLPKKIEINFSCVEKKCVEPTFKLDLQISTALAQMFAQDFGNFPRSFVKPVLPKMFLLWIPKPPELLRKNSDSWAARVLRSSAIWAANDKDSFRRIYINFSTKNHGLLSKQILVHFRRSHPKVPVSDVISLNP